jgi:hypothetical protein
MNRLQASSVRIIYAPPGAKRGVPALMARQQHGGGARVRPPIPSFCLRRCVFEYLYRWRGA